MSKRILGMGNAVLDILAEANEEDLTKNNLKKGLASLCIGGGEATALTLEIIN